LDSSPLKSFGCQLLSLPSTAGYGSNGCCCWGGCSGFCGVSPVGCCAAGKLDISTGVSGLNTSAANALNLSTISVTSSVGGIPRLDKSIGVTTGIGMVSDCALVLCVLVIDGDPLSVKAGVALLLNGDSLLLNGYAGPSPDSRDIGVHTGVDVPVTGVCVAGGLSSSALSNCSCSCSDSELSGALYDR